MNNDDDYGEYTDKIIKQGAATRKKALKGACGRPMIQCNIHTYKYKMYKHILMHTCNKYEKDM